MNRGEKMFEDVIVTKGSRKAGRKKLFTFPVSLALHVIALGAIVVASLWIVGGVQER